MSDEQQPPSGPEGDPGARAPGPSTARPPRLVQPFPGAPPVEIADGYDTPRYAPPPPPRGWGSPRQLPPGPGPAGSGPDPRPRALAVTALVLAVVGVLVAFLPVLGFLTGLLLLAGLVCAIIALVSPRQGGKGLGIAALVTSVLGGVVAVAVVLISVFFVGLGGLWGMGGESRPAESIPSPPAQDERVYGAAEAPLVLEAAAAPLPNDDDVWWYTVIVDNPNVDAVFEDTLVDLELTDADGEVVAITSDYVSLYPGTSAISGYFLAVPSDAPGTDVTVLLPPAEDGRLLDAEELGALVVSDVQTTTDEIGTTVTGTATVTSAVAPAYPAVTVVARDATGTIIAAQWHPLEPGGDPSSPFEVVFYEPLPTDATVEVYPSL